MSNNLLNITKLFANRFFEVPDYQRGYAWEERQLTDLIEDLERISNTKHSHYTGTIVITPKKDNSPTYEIVDGQQRLTTIIIFLKVIYDTDPNKYKWLKKIFFLRGTIGNEIQILKLNQDYNNFFLEYILNGNSTISPQNKYEHNLKYAKTYLNAYIHKNKSTIKVILNSILNRLGFLLFVPNNDKEIGIMFEVINNRGKELSELEKIKNYFIYYSSVFDKSTLRSNINIKWKQIIDYLSKAGQTSIDDENSFLRNCYLVFFEPNKSKSWNVYREIKKHFNVNDKKKLTSKVLQIEQFILFLEIASLYYAYFFNDSFFDNHFKGSLKNELRKILKILRCHPVNASILPLFLALMHKLKIDENEAKIIELLKTLEILNFRIYVLPKITSRTDSKQGTLFSWANHFYHDNDWTSDKDSLKHYSTYNNIPINGDIFNWLRTELKEFTKYYCNELKFVQSLTLDSDEFEDFMDWNGLRFFLASYEESLQQNSGHSWNIENINNDTLDTKDNPNDYLSREHIWAKKNMVEEFDENNLQKRRLGNFVFLGLSKNKELGALSISDKVKILVNINDKNKGEAHLFQVSKLKDIHKEASYILNSQYKRKTKYYYEDLSKLINDQRETELIKFALKRWRFGDESFNKFKEINSFVNKKNKFNYILN